jgi:bacterioferritin (cytochrome b1)
MLLSELKDLLRLTAFEQTVATVRRAQARTTPIERELAENAEKAGERLALLRSAVAQVGGVPDVVGPALGKAGAFVQTQVNQVQTLQGALLGDLALEHQLRDRTRYARVLAQSLGETSVLPVLDRLETAHSATIEWLETRLAEVGRTGTSALKATPVQAAVSTVRRAASTPLGALSAGVNRTGGLLGRVTGRAPQSVQDALQQLEDTARGAADTAVSTAKSVASKAASKADQAEDVVEDAVIDLTRAAGEGAEKVAAAGENAAAATGEKAAQLTEQVLEATGGADVDDAKAPFAGYERLTGDSVMRHVEDTDDVEELRTLLAFEQAHKARKGVLQAAQQRLDALASA